jgi:hypothetical protein
MRPQSDSAQQVGPSDVLSEIDAQQQPESYAIAVAMLALPGDNWERCSPSHPSYLRKDPFADAGECVYHCACLACGSNSGMLACTTRCRYIMVNALCLVHLFLESPRISALAELR